MPPPKKDANRNVTPLWIVTLFVSSTEITLGAVTTQTQGAVQLTLTAFVVGFPLLIAGCFFWTLFNRPWVFYSPREYNGVDPAPFIAALQGKPNKIVTKTEDLEDQVTTFGNPDRFQLLFKARGTTWKKSTKAFQVPGGCIVQVSSEQTDLDGSWTIAEGLTYVPGVVIIPEENGDGKYLGPLHSE